MSDFIRYAKNIRKIAEQAKSNNKSLGDAEARGRILGERRTGFQNGNGTTGVSGAGVPGKTSPLIPANLLGYATTQQLQNVFNTVNNEYRTINNALNARIGSKITGINSLKDCVTGKGVTINNMPEFRPPENWDDADTPSETNPIRWDFGFYYQAPTTPTVSAPTAQAVVDLLPAALSGGGETFTFAGYIDPGSIGSTAPFAAKFTSTPGSLTAQVPIDRLPCGMGTDPYCPTNYIVRWPEDGQMQLTRGADGKFKYSENEAAADVIAEYTDNQHTKLDLCFDDGSGRKAGIQPTYDGGYLLYERDPITGDPIGRVQKMASDGITVEEQISPDEMFRWIPTGS